MNEAESSKPVTKGGSRVLPDRTESCPINPGVPPSPETGESIPETQERRGEPRPLRPRAIGILALLAMASFHLGFLFPSLSWLVLVWLGCLFALRRTACGRWAFYTGLAIGLGIYGPQLHFFWTIFGPAAVALWLILAFWLALFLLLLHGVDRYWGVGWALALAPVLWLGLEFFRSELYYLRFAWFTAGSFLTPADWSWSFSKLGVYGLGAVLMLLAAGSCALSESWFNGWRPRGPVNRKLLFGTLLLASLCGVAVLKSLARARAYSGPSFHLHLTGIQLEFPHLREVLLALDDALRRQPETDVFMLGEYTFDGPVPSEIRDWCREHRRHVVAGGREPLPGGRYYNTVYVVSSEGEVVFQQAKAVPIQFFNDGLPAPAQHLWRPGMRMVFDPQAPKEPPRYEWLKDEAQDWPCRVGFCICYDLSYGLVVDHLIRPRAGSVPLLLVPALDAQDWGLHQHRLNARMTAIRAAEYRLWIFRVATSGISQWVDPGGRVLAETSYPGQGELLTAAIHGKYYSNSMPADRVFGPASALSTVVVMLVLAIHSWQRRRHSLPLTTDH